MKLPSEGVPTHHHLFQFENYRISYVESPGVHNKRHGRNARPTKNKH